MSLHDEDPRLPDEDAAGSGSQENSSRVKPEDLGQTTWSNENYGNVSGVETLFEPPVRSYPEDLQISWSWAHFIVFVIFGFISLVLIQGVLALAYVPHQRMSSKQLEEYLISKPQFAIGSMLLWYAAIFFFLYVTLSVLRGHSFWQTLGWRKLAGASGGMPRNPLAYLLAGGGLSLFINLVTTRLKTPENIPIEELFKFRQTAMLFVAMAVFVAPLVEETLFRGIFVSNVCAIIWSDARDIADRLFIWIDAWRTIGVDVEPGGAADDRRNHFYAGAGTNGNRGGKFSDAPWLQRIDLCGRGSGHSWIHADAHREVMHSAVIERFVK